ncbi:MAG: hypothetical protein IPI82_02755 [Candidatus Microthrix sp.]|nr:hypothetical protein [Candidatus Microthrix sp.]
MTARHWSDLVYVDKNRALEKRFDNYTYLPIPTREPDVEKRYIQDVVRNDFTADKLGFELDPTNTHVFVCGNPDMIGLPDESGDQPVFPDPRSVRDPRRAWLQARQAQRPRQHPLRRVLVGRGQLSGTL